MAKDKKNKKGDATTAPNQPIPNSLSYGKVNSKAGKTNTLTQQDLANLSPEQLNQLQLEEAIKESQNPSLKLKKLKSPLSFKGCLLNMLLFIVLTIIVVFIVSYYMVDKFNLWIILKDILSEFGISQFFSNLFKRIGNVFRGKGWTLDENIKTAFRLIFRI